MLHRDPRKGRPEAETPDAQSKTTFDESSHGREAHTANGQGEPCPPPAGAAENANLGGAGNDPNDDAEKFLNALDPGGKFTFQTFDDSEQDRKHLVKVLHGTLAQHRMKLQELND